MRQVQKRRRHRTLSADAVHLVRTLRAGYEVVFRGTTGRAEYVVAGFGRHDCTRALKELKRHDLVRVAKVDKRCLWVWYELSDAGLRAKLGSGPEGPATNRS